jgi:hypothetical protein
MRQSGKIRWLVVFFCVFAALRVGLYSAAFPFFNNVDEEAHFDLVLKYSQGKVPESFESISPVSALYIAKYSSPEFFWRTVDFQENRYPEPLWKSGPADAQKRINENASYWQSITNHESSNGPLYYAVAGAWLKTGIWSGICQANTIAPLFFIRFLNVLLVIILVWFSYRSTELVFPTNHVVQLGVPLIAAIMPQDTFYSIQSDVLSPVCFAFAFFYCLKFIESEKPAPRLAFIAGLSISMTLLVKISNLPFLPIFMIFVIVKKWKSMMEGSRKTLLSHIIFFSTAILFVVAWMTWNKFVFGDFIGSDAKIGILGWTHKPFADLGNNALFTAKGASDWWQELMASFWRGEFVWSRIRLAMPALDLFYWLSSLIFVTVGSISFLKRKQDPKGFKIFAFWNYGAAILFIFILSISLDFGDSPYPSAEKPYFTSGRLMSGALVPFLLLYVRGFDLVFTFIKKEKIKLLILGLIAVIITSSEFLITREVFASPYNFIHAGNQ